MNDFNRMAVSVKKPKLHEDVRPFAQADAPAMANVFRKWQRQPPDIEGFVQNAIANVGFSDKSESVIMVAAKLAAEPNANAFHGNKHFLQVFATTYTLGLRALQEERITSQTFGNLLTAALIHDYKHDGTTNNGEQFRLENRSCEESKASLIEAGADEDDLEIIKAFVLTTDVSKDFDDPRAASPADSLKRFTLNSDVEGVFPQLRVLIEKTTPGNDLVDAALMLQDADVGIAHLDVQTTHQAGRELAKERGGEYTPQNQIVFMDKICHRQCFSKAGREIIQPRLEAVMQALQMPPQAPESVFQ
ncbi:MAG: hypothetical protein R3E13_09485 [Alphaproteobacteria bacterium]